MEQDFTSIPMRAIGWNEKGLVAFMVGGEHLTYLDLPEDLEKVKKELPYISEKDVKAVNKETNKHGKKK